MKSNFGPFIQSLGKKRHDNSSPDTIYYITINLNNLSIVMILLELFLFYSF